MLNGVDVPRIHCNDDAVATAAAARPTSSTTSTSHLDARRLSPTDRPPTPPGGRAHRWDIRRSQGWGNRAA
jgi:hypothetical protein